MDNSVILMITLFLFQREEIQNSKIVKFFRHNSTDLKVTKWK